MKIVIENAVQVIQLRKTMCIIVAIYFSPEASLVFLRKM